MKPYYVYELVDPRDSKPFYVGKGQSRRGWQHGKYAAKGLPGRKCDRIREIRANGLEHEVRIVERFARESAAYAFEVKRIAELGLENLTNETSGGKAPNWVTDKPLDPGLSFDRTAVYCWLKLMVRTRGLTLEPIMRFAGKELALPSELTLKIEKWFAQAIERRGNDWAASEAKRHNVNLTFSMAV